MHIGGTAGLPSIAVFSGSIFMGNQAQRDAGAVKVTKASFMNCTRCIFDRNKAFRKGGAIDVTENSNITVTSSTFISNEQTEASYWGGAINLRQSSGDLSESNFTNNTAAGSGGAISADEQAAIKCHHCVFVLNKQSSVGGFGGAVKLTFSNGDLPWCSFSDNTATGGGGAISQVGGRLAFAYSNFTRNKQTLATSGGGAIYALSEINQPTNMSATMCSFTNNSAAGNGGALALLSGSLADCEHCSFTGNSQTNQHSGGGAVYVSGSTARMASSTFGANSAEGHGGGVAVQNMAQGSGGENTAGRFECTRCLFVGQTSQHSGGAVQVWDDSVANLTGHHSARAVFEWQLLSQLNVLVC